MSLTRLLLLQLPVRCCAAGTASTRGAAASATAGGRAPSATCRPTSASTSTAGDTASASWAPASAILGIRARTARKVRMTSHSRGALCPEQEAESDLSVWTLSVCSGLHRPQLLRPRGVYPRRVSLPARVGRSQLRDRQGHVPRPVFRPRHLQRGDQHLHLQPELDRARLLSRFVPRRRADRSVTDATSCVQRGYRDDGESKTCS